MFSADLPNITPFFQRVFTSLAAVSIGTFVFLMLLEILGSPTTERSGFRVLVILAFNFLSQGVAFWITSKMERDSRISESAEAFQARQKKVHLAFSFIFWCFAALFAGIFLALCR